MATRTRSDRASTASASHRAMPGKGHGIRDPVVGGRLQGTQTGPLWSSDPPCRTSPGNALWTVMLRSKLRSKLRSTLRSVRQVSAFAADPISGEVVDARQELGRWPPLHAVHPRAG